MFVKPDNEQEQENAMMGVFSPVNSQSASTHISSTMTKPTMSTHMSSVPVKKTPILSSHVPSSTSAHSSSLNAHPTTMSTSTNNNNMSSLISAAVTEALSPVVDVLRQDLQNIHLDLLKQFHLQKVTMQNALVQLLPNHLTALEAELARLQSENKRLKMKCNEL